MNRAPSQPNRAPTIEARETPTASGERITNLDAIRGFAVLGILVMNAVSYGLNEAAYFNLDAQGSNNWMDWVVGGAGEIFIDQKTMGLFSMLFGAGIVLFADRTEAKGTKSPFWFSMWRNLLLLIIGFAHSLIWEGDVLMVYAACAPFLILMRRRSPKTLLLVGSSLVLWSAAVAVVVQGQVPANGEGLGPYWLIDPEAGYSDPVGLFLLNDFFSRAAGMMLIGVAIFKLGILNGTRSKAFYRKLVSYGLGVGIPLASAGLALQFQADFGPDVAIIGEGPNTLATIPIVLGHVGLISLWNQRPATWLHHRIRAAGRMALTNYLTQTIIGIAVLRGLFSVGDLGRSQIFLVVLAIWTLQLSWSKWWLDRFKFGPFEWVWRCATYRKLQPIR